MESEVLKISESSPVGKNKPTSTLFNNKSKPSGPKKAKISYELPWLYIFYNEFIYTITSTFTFNAKCFFYILFTFFCTF